METSLIDKHREINVDFDDWYESVYEQFEEYCDSVGVDISTHQETHQQGNNSPKSFTVRDITWSGFWSQGDGAAFGGLVVDMEKAIIDLENRFPLAYKYFKELDGYHVCSWRVGSGNNIRFNGLETEDIRLYLPEGDEHPFAEIWQKQLDDELAIIESELGELAEGLCDKLYKMLRDEYDALTSDEAVWEAIVANDLHLEEEVA